MNRIRLGICKGKPYERAYEGEYESNRKNP
jgi:hypothetical protein